MCLLVQVLVTFSFDVTISHVAGRSKPYNADGRRLWVTDGTEDPFTGTCLFFIKQNAQRAVTALNIHQVGEDEREGGDEEERTGREGGRGEISKTGPKSTSEGLIFQHVMNA